MSEEYQYDAFISYRHLPLDSAVAEKLQKLLESYKAPIKSADGKKLKINRIFRDQSELPTSGSLDDSLKRALLSSRFLIVVLSKETQNSKWCMEEIKNFKEANGGKISHILPILVDGEPDESLPDILRYETRERTLEDGSTEKYEVELEPLCCDVRADSLKGSMKKLKTEFLRICAPIFGVGFDDLFMRHKRRKKRIAITTACITLALLIGVSAVISIFAFQTYTAQKQRKVKLIESYTQQGASMMENGNYEKALAYYNKVLELDSENQAAKTGSLLLLQQCGWLNNESESHGYITQNVLYDAKYEALAVDSTGKKLLNSTRENILVSDKDSNELGKLNDFGEFITCAEDGSCWSFANDRKITFYFPDDSSYFQVEKPTAINPHCSNDDVEADDLYSESLSMPSMAFNKSRAAVCYGGYLYFYNLNAEKSTASLFETVDLSLVFEKLAEKDSMTRHFYMWADPNGKYCVVSNGTAAAVFDVSDDKNIYYCGFHETYWRALTNVAFSEDKNHYALVYGNAKGIYENPGGCIEVYDNRGRQCFATEFDNNIPLSDAAFKPDSSYIAAWGKGELQIWDWSTKRAVAAPVQIPDISSALWVEDGKLAVSNKKGTIKYYSVSEFESAKSDIELKEFKANDYRGTSVKLESGYTIKNGVSKLIVSDSNNKTTDEFPLDNTAADKMFADNKNSTVYLWSSDGNFLFGATTDKNGKIISSSNLNTQGKNPVALYSVFEGIIAEMGSGELLYYTTGESEPKTVIKPAINGSLSGIDSAENGLLGFVVCNQTQIEGISYSYSYCAELWDLTGSVKLTNFESSDYEIKNITLSEDRFAFEQKGEKTVLIVDAPTPNKNALETLNNISCYNIGDNGKASIVNPSFDPEKLGNWKDYYSPADKSEEADKSIISKMQSVLDEKGEKTWIEEYNKWWKSDEPKKLDSSELCDIVKDYYPEAIDKGYKKEAAIGIKAFFDIFDNAELPDYATLYQLETIASDIVYLAPEHKDLVKNHYKHFAEKYEASYKITKDDSYDLICAYSCRLATGFLDGKGLKAFDVKSTTMDKVYNEKISELKNLESFKPYIYLFSGNGKAAAKQFEKTNLISGSVDYYSAIKEFSAYVRVGALPEKDYSDFIQSLTYPTGTIITKVTLAQLEAGLKPGDVVVAVNGIYYGLPDYLYTGKKVTPKKVTFIHNDKVSTIKAESDWLFHGGYPT